MRTSAFAAAIVVVGVLVSTVKSEDDFSALLADLTFGDAPAAAVPSYAAGPKPVAPSVASEGISMPPVASAKVDVPTAVDTQPQVGESDVVGMLESDLFTANSSTPKVALQNPVPTGPVIDLDAAFALQDGPAAKLDAVPTLDAVPSFAAAPTFAVPSQPLGNVPSQAVGHMLHPNTSDCGCGQPSNTCGTGAEIVCRPRTPVHLPSSTLRQYFRSDPCYTNLWDGYQRKCCYQHGACANHGRFQPTCGEVLDCAPCAPANCAKCDGGCD